MSRQASNARGVPITGVEDLLRVFREGMKSPDRLLFGMESEKVGLDLRRGGAPVPFDGPDGIETILKDYAKHFGWEPTIDEGRTIGLDHGGTAITLEPGGQLELSSRPHSSLTDLRDELVRHTVELREVSKPHGVEWLHLGLHPYATVETMPWVPKTRYGIMRRYNATLTGHHPFDMMLLTASLQPNFDFSDEADARRKVRVGSVLGPVVGAMYANSYFEGGDLNGYCTRRLRIWRDTDPDRCGIPRFFTDTSFTFEKYANYALDIPMYFIVREGKYVDMTGQTFRQFLSSRREDPAGMTDWVNHLTTIFTDVRVKDHLEFRTADAHGTPLAMALMAFWAGLIYEETALAAVESRFEKFGWEEIEAANLDAAQKGLGAAMGGEPILQVARDAVALAVEGLSRWDRTRGTNDLRLLEPLRDLVERGTSLAERHRRMALRRKDLFLEMRS